MPPKQVFAVHIKKMRYNKLVRDKIPDIIRGKGETPVTRIASDEEYSEKLKEKLVEEVKEYSENPSKEELADILEVIKAIQEHENISHQEIERIRKKKALERGGFKKRLILEETKKE